MLCSNCHSPLPTGAKFCPQCGHPTQTAQPKKGTDPIPNTGAPAIEPIQAVSSPAKEWIPQRYVDRLEQARAGHAMEGERRIVTILFCDVTGSTAMAEQLDPEEWTGIMNQAFRLLTAPVYLYEGALARLMGDSILAFFGAPIAHEDDAQRAVLAGLQIVREIQGFREEMVRQYGLDFNVRVGINTGLVVVGAVGSDLLMEYTAMGDAVNLAARMEQTAQPGTVQVAEHTYERISGLFDAEPLGEITVKGKSAPVKAYRILGQRPGAAPVRGIAGLRSPLVGRDQELQTLLNRMGLLVSGQGGIVSLIGEAGLGKSRLAAELRKQAVGVQWVEGRSFSYETARPFAPFIDLLARFFGLSENLSESEKAARLREKTGELMQDQAGEVEPFLASLLGTPLSGENLERVRYLEPPHLRERLSQAVRQFFERLAAQQPVILVFEDLHWTDQASLDLIQQLMPLAGNNSLLILVLFRPNLQDSSWRFHEIASQDYASLYTTITLNPLDESESRLLVSNLLHIEDLPEQVRSLILQKAEGNPFFVEEVIRSLLDAHLIVRDNSHWRATREINTISVPETLIGVITTRLDHLDDNLKHVIQTASVIGREFSSETLQAISDDPMLLEPALAELQQREFIHEKRRETRRLFTFKHVLTQETAYESLLHSTRRALHMKVAQYMEQTGVEPPNEIARHFIDARQGQRALPYLIEAADQASRTYAVQEASSYYRQALQWIPEAGQRDLARQAYEGLGRVLSFANDVPAAVENYQTMYQYGKKQGDIPIQVSALNKISELVGMRMGQFPEAEQTLVDAEHLAREYGDQRGLAEMFIIRCVVCSALGDFEGAFQYLTESVEIGRALEEKEHMALGLAHIAQTLLFMTRFDEAWKVAEEGRKAALEVGNQEFLSDIMTTTMTMVHYRNGDLQAARHMALEGVQIAGKIGAAYPESMGSFLLGSLCQATGEYEEAIRWLHRALDAGVMSGYIFQQAMPLCKLGTVLLEISDQLLPQTLNHHRKALELMEMPGGHMAGGMGWVDLGFCALNLGELDYARGYFEKGLTVPTPTTRLQRPAFLAGLAAIERLQGNLDQAREYLQQAHQYAADREMKQFSPILELSSGQLDLTTGNPDKALAHFELAQGLASGMGMRPLICRAHASAALALQELGKTGEAQGHLDAAAQITQQIAADFKDEHLKALFLKNRQAPENWAK